MRLSSAVAQVFPQAEAVRFDDHAALDHGVVGEVGALRTHSIYQSEKFSAREGMRSGLLGEACCAMGILGVIENASH
jgi:hypothetical protein